MLAPRLLSATVSSWLVCYKSLNERIVPHFKCIDRILLLLHLIVLILLATHYTLHFVPLFRFTMITFLSVVNTLIL